MYRYYTSTLLLGAKTPGMVPTSHAVNPFETKLGMGTPEAGVLAIAFSQALML